MASQINDVGILRSERYGYRKTDVDACLAKLHRKNYELHSENLRLKEMIKKLQKKQRLPHKQPSGTADDI